MNTQIDTQADKLQTCCNLLAILEDRIADAVPGPEADKMSSIVTVVSGTLTEQILFLEDLRREGKL